ncbi:hypothetical protein GCM10011491_40810 [Brucella endophytica]|uniref:DUF4282 domain-containing protein n=1 Tax=Brucella endophytica TaxID=1963359 RepID=A0A916SNA5_9HYPH|nr:DUF4282 domain-containing protein [Brucella endophytica]GGB08610.1 hypothetical protein GCM10011491_40810 [Brucella endophytica]
MAIKDFFVFEKFLTPVLVKIVFWVGVAGVVLVPIFAYQRSFSDATLPNIVGSLLMLVGTLIAWRVFCESLILLFKIYDRLTEIRDQGLPKQ